MNLEWNASSVLIKQLHYVHLLNIDPSALAFEFKCSTLKLPSWRNSWHGGRSCALSRCPWGWQSPVASLGDPCRISTSHPHLNVRSKASLHSCTSPPSFILTVDTCLGAARPLLPLRFASSPFLAVPSSHAASPSLCSCPASRCYGNRQLQLPPAPSLSLSLSLFTSCERFLVLVLCFHTLLLKPVLSLPCCQGEAACLWALHIYCFGKWVVSVILAEYLCSEFLKLCSVFLN